MTRKTARELAVHIAFEMGLNPLPPEELIETMLEPEYFATLAKEDELYSEYPDEKQLDYIRRLAGGIGGHSAELDSYIDKYSKGWNIGRISRVAVAVLRTAMFEMLYMPEVPPRAAANEAVEIARRYEDEKTVKFVNGIIGSFVRGELEAL